MAAAAVMAALILVALRRPGGAAEIAMLVAATGFCAPFLFDYDLLIFAVPAAWLVSEATRTGLYVAPMGIKLTAAAPGTPLRPVALAILAALVVRRVFSPRRWTERPPRTLAAGIRSDDDPLGARSPP